MVTAVDFVHDGEPDRYHVTLPPTATAYHPLFSFSSSAKKHGADGNFFEIITSNEVHYFLQAATSEERKDWIKAVQAVSKCGK